MSNNPTLKVLEAYTRDVGRGVARIDYDTMDSLSASTGDVIEIKGGKRRTVAKCLPLYPSDEGKGVVRIDGLSRNNADVAIGDTVSITKVKALPAEKITVAPLEAIPPIDERYLADALESVPLMKGDNVMVPYFGGRLTFEVVAVTPASTVLVTQKTVFSIGIKNETVRGMTHVAYEDIGGLREEIQKVREMIELPLRHPEIFEKLGIEAPKGILLHGPPGTGKTLLAKAVASETNAHFISISGPEIMSKFYGESEARIREIFKESREKAPSIIFFDEIDSIAPTRGGMEGGSGFSGTQPILSQLLTEMDGVQQMQGVMVIAATNRVDIIDTALLRPGRFDKIVYVPIPDKNTRIRILEVHIKGKPVGRDIDLMKIADMTNGFSGAEVSAVVNTAISLVLHEYLQKYPTPEEAAKHTSDAVVSSQYFEDAVKKIKKQRETRPGEPVASPVQYR